jgi:hypothetical protein
VWIDRGDDDLPGGQMGVGEPLTLISLILRQRWVRALQGHQSQRKGCGFVLSSSIFLAAFFQQRTLMDLKLQE